ncbi:MAG: flagellar motor protein MotB [Spirochaetales bacterium]|nr:flagellar motor protein MotB [Spirochaetales bacterium]
MYAQKKKKQKKVDEGAPQWLLTYGDMTTLVLVFFVAMFSTATIDGSELRMILAAFQGLGVMQGGNTLQSGKLAELGNNIMTLPSTERGRALDKARKLAQSIFEPEIKTKKLALRVEERGLIISLSAELFFAPGSADVNPEVANPVLRKVMLLLAEPELKDKKIRIEGHTDDVPLGEPDETNWDLSAGRALNVLKALADIGVDEKLLSMSGYADNQPVSSNETDEGRANNRRVDIVVLSEGHL